MSDVEYTHPAGARVTPGVRSSRPGHAEDFEVTRYSSWCEASLAACTVGARPRDMLLVVVDAEGQPHRNDAYLNRRTDAVFWQCVCGARSMPGADYTSAKAARYAAELEHPIGRLPREAAPQPTED